MKYKFHVGDYVETKDGWVGYVTTIDQYWSKVCTCWGLHIIGNIQKNHNKGKLDIDIAQSDIWRHFNRIGQYDFTKKDEGKIEPLAEEYIKSFHIYKTTITENDSEWRSIDIGAVGKKINELIEAVNRLEEKVNEMA